MTIATSAGASIYRFALGVINSGVASKGRFIEFDDTGTLGSGFSRSRIPVCSRRHGLTAITRLGADTTSTLITSIRNRFAMVGNVLPQTEAGGISNGSWMPTKTATSIKVGGLNYPERSAVYGELY